MNFIIYEIYRYLSGLKHFTTFYKPPDGIKSTDCPNPVYIIYTSTCTFNIHTNLVVKEYSPLNTSTCTFTIQFFDNH